MYVIPSPYFWRLHLYSGAGLPASSQTFSTRCHPLYKFIFPISTGSFFPSGCLNTFTFVNGREILFLNWHIQSLPCLPTLPSRPCILDSALVPPLKWLLIDLRTSNSTVFTKFLIPQQRVTLMTLPHPSTPFFPGLKATPSLGFPPPSLATPQCPLQALPLCLFLNGWSSRGYSSSRLLSLCSLSGKSHLARIFCYLSDRWPHESLSPDLTRELQTCRPTRHSDSLACVFHGHLRRNILGKWGVHGWVCSISSAGYLGSWNFLQIGFENVSSRLLLESDKHFFSPLFSERRELFLFACSGPLFTSLWEN